MFFEFPHFLVRLPLKIDGFGGYFDPLITGNRSLDAWIRRETAK